MPVVLVMPFDDPGAYWLLIDKKIHLIKTEYDYLKAVDDVCNTSYTDAKVFAKDNNLRSIK